MNIQYNFNIVDYTINMIIWDRKRIQDYQHLRSNSLPALFVQFNLSIKETNTYIYTIESYCVYIDIFHLNLYIYSWRNVGLILKSPNKNENIVDKNLYISGHLILLKSIQIDYEGWSNVIKYVIRLHGNVDFCLYFHIRWIPTHFQ